jgi:hypothetical protein
MRDCMRRWCGAASVLPQAAVPPGARSLRLFVGTRGAPSRLHRQDRWRRGDGRVPRSGRRGARGAVNAGRGGKLQSRAQRPGDEVEIGRVASSSPTCRARPSRTISSATSLRRSCSGQSRRRSRYPLPRVGARKFPGDSQAASHNAHRLIQAAQCRAVRGDLSSGQRLARFRVGQHRLRDDRLAAVALMFQPRRGVHCRAEIIEQCLARPGAT